MGLPRSNRGIPSGNRQLQAAGLDGLGSNDRGDNVTLSATAQKLLEVADCILVTSSKNLQRNGNVDTGRLDRDMYAGDIEVNGSVLGLNIWVPQYGIYLDQGVNGTEVNHGSPFSYRGKMPPAAKLLAWARRRANRAVKYKPTSKLERKDNKINKMVSDANKYRSLAFAMAKSIQKKGIKPTKFFSKAVAGCAAKFKKTIGEGLRIDVINSLNGNNNSK